MLKIQNHLSKSDEFLIGQITFNQNIKHLPNVKINPLLKNQNHLSKSDEFLIGQITLSKHSTKTFNQNIQPKH